MQYKGYQFRVNKALGWRNAKNGDLYLDGEQIFPNYCVWMRLKDCPEVSRACWLSNGKEYSIVSPDKCDNIIPIVSHSLTNLGSGPYKLDHELKQAIGSVYLVYDGICYQAVHRSREFYRKFMEDYDERLNKYVSPRCLKRLIGD